LTVGQLELDGPVAYAKLEAADEKNREGSYIAIRDDLVTDLRQWLAGKLEVIQNEAAHHGESIPARLPADMRVFRVPRDLVRILDRDLKLAGIPKRDERGRTIDVHALRHTFGTHLSKGGVTPRTAQAAMRHSTIDLTMNTYTDPRLLDIHGALDVLPSLSLNEGVCEREQATGTTGAESALAPMLAPKADESSKSWSIRDNRPAKPPEQGNDSVIAVSACPVIRNNPLTITVNGLQVERETGFEPATSSLGS